MDLKQIFKNNKKWVDSKLSLDKNYFKNLAKGQSPELLYIGCSDSRVTAESLMGLEPGEVFVHRNVANVVSNLDLNIMSVIDYAVAHLKVKHVVVCGHYYCGGVAAAMESDDMGILNPWLKNIKDVYRLHEVELKKIKSKQKRYERLVELNVQEQCTNILKLPEVQEGQKKWGLKVHGWVFDIGSGELIDLKIKVPSKVSKLFKVG